MIFPMLRTLPLVAALLLPVSAAAHAILIGSTPAIHATVPAGHVSFTLHYNSRIDRGRSRLTLIGPGKSQTRLPIGADGAGDVMVTAADLTEGDYTVRWQVLATDGHITRGDLPFTVQAP
jgi:methionine-rich copper-binding protein CopC